MIQLDEKAVRERLRPRLDEARFRRAIENVTSDRLLLSLFLMSVSHGEGLGEAGVAAIGQKEIAALLYELRRQRLEEHGHMEAARLLAQELFPEFFAHGHYRYEDFVVGRDHYLRVREANRRRLRERGRQSRLNLYLTTTFGHEVMLELLFGAVIEALHRSALPQPLTERVELVLTTILRLEETRAGLIAQHNALLAADRASLSVGACDALARLARLTAADYEWAAELAVSEILVSYGPYADADAVRARLHGA
jgi:hypothetical protein